MAPTYKASRRSSFEGEKNLMHSKIDCQLLIQSPLINYSLKFQSQSSQEMDQLMNESNPDSTYYQIKKPVSEMNEVEKEEAVEGIKERESFRARILHPPQFKDGKIQDDDREKGEDEEKDDDGEVEETGPRRKPRCALCQNHPILVGIKLIPAPHTKNHICQYKRKNLNELLLKNMDAKEKEENHDCNGIFYDQYLEEEKDLFKSCESCITTNDKRKFVKREQKQKRDKKKQEKRGTNKGGGINRGEMNKGEGIGSNGNQMKPETGKEGSKRRKSEDHPRVDSVPTRRPVSTSSTLSPSSSNPLSSLIDTLSPRDRVMKTLDEMRKDEVDELMKEIVEKFPIVPKLVVERMEQERQMIQYLQFIENIERKIWRPYPYPH